MKILIAADTYYPHVNGASYFARRLAYYLHRRGHHIRVIAPSRGFCNEVFEQDEVNVTGVRSMPALVYKNFRFSPRMIQGRAVQNAVLSWNPDIVHVQSHFFICKQVVKTAKKMGLPTIVTNHFMPENLIHYFPLPGFAKQWLKAWGWKQLANVFKDADIVTTPTRTAAQLLDKIGLNKEVLAVSCGIDLDRFHPLKGNGHLKLKYKIPEDKKILLYVGRLDKEKNIDLILHGFSQVAHLLDLHLVIAGKGAEEKNLKQLVHESGLGARATFTGFVPDEQLPGLYAAAQCFIIAGTAELQSIVTMEAMASELPVIAARAMALPELVQHGVTGCLFEPGDETGIADCLTNVFQNETSRKEMGKASLLAIEKHDIRKIINQFERIYQKLLCDYGK
ncbi:MAG: glycosyltransferase family 4 protein [Deltaproteobacteria bacterium]|nr:glycosyltransferase family 4 protein [Deltaproteobacteria bacterium]